MLMAVAVSSVTPSRCAVRYRLPDERQIRSVPSLQADLENGVNLEQTIRLRKKSLNSTALWVR